MATTLDALVMRVSAETGQLEQSMRDVRKDINRVNQTFREMKTETDKVEEQAAALVRRFKAGKISADDYQRAMGHLNEKYRNAQIAAGGLNGQLAKLGSRIASINPAFVAAAVVVGSAVIAYKSLKTALDAALETMGELDPIIKGSRTINALVGDVQALSFALGEVAGMNEERTIKSLQNLARVVGQAKLEGGTAAKAFQQLGLSAENLARMSPTEQFNAVARALQGVESASERARIAQQLFGREGRDIVNGLMTQAATLDEAQQAARDFGLTLSQPQATAIEAANDAVGRLSAHLEGIRRQFAAELAPAIKVFADELNAVIPIGKDLQGTLQVISATTVAMAGLLMDAIKLANAIRQIQNGNIAGAMSAMEIVQDGLLANTDELLNRYAEAVNAARKAAAADAERAQAAADVADQTKNTTAEADRLTASYEAQAAELLHQFNALQIGEKAAMRLKLLAEGYTEEQVKTLQARQDQIDQLKEEQKLREKLDGLMKQGQRLMEQASPLAAVEKQLADLNVLLRVGAINEATFFKERNRILAENVKDLREMGAADSVQAGSAQAASMLQQRMADEQNEQIAKLEEQRILQEVTIGVLERTEKAIKELRPVGTFR